MKKNLKKIWKEERAFIVLLVFCLFLTFNLARAINTITELKEENAELWAMVDYQNPATPEENY